MATGLIGTSRISSGSTGTTTGTSLNYTCPSSSVSYAVISISAAVAVSAYGVQDTARGRAGTCAAIILGGGTTQNPTMANSIAYSVILGPGQTWTDFAEVTVAINNSAAYAYAYLQASVLEVV
jgi:hypothetical protein